MYYGAYQFPNLLLNLHPDCAMYYIGYPKGPNHTTVVSEYLFRPETIADPALFKPEPVVELWDLISKQDWEVCRARADRRRLAHRSPPASIRARTGSSTTSTSATAQEMGRPLLG